MSFRMTILAGATVLSLGIVGVSIFLNTRLPTYERPYSTEDSSKATPASAKIAGLSPKGKSLTGKPSSALSDLGPTLNIVGSNKHEINRSVDPPPIDAPVPAFTSETPLQRVYSQTNTTN